MTARLQYVEHVLVLHNIPQTTLLERVRHPGCCTDLALVAVLQHVKADWRAGWKCRNVSTNKPAPQLLPPPPMLLLLLLQSAPSAPLLAAASPSAAVRAATAAASVAGGPPVRGLDPSPLQPCSMRRSHSLLRDLKKSRTSLLRSSR